MNLLSDFLDSVLRFLKLRKTTRAAADAVEGDAIIAQANREAAEMREAAELAEARKRLDTDLSGVPIVAAPPPAPVASVLQPTVTAVQPIAAAPPSTTSATTAPTSAPSATTAPTIVAVPTLPTNRPN
jgi:hypothetical protein